MHTRSCTVRVTILSGAISVTGFKFYGVTHSYFSCPFLYALEISHNHSRAWDSVVRSSHGMRLSSTWLSEHQTFVPPWRGEGSCRQTFVPPWRGEGSCRQTPPKELSGEPVDSKRSSGDCACVCTWRWESRRGEERGKVARLVEHQSGTNEQGLPHN